MISLKIKEVPADFREKAVRHLLKDGRDIYIPVMSEEDAEYLEALGFEIFFLRTGPKSGKLFANLGKSDKILKLISAAR